MYYTQQQPEPGPCSVASRALDWVYAGIVVGVVTLTYGAILSAVLAGFLVILDKALS